MGEEEDEFFLTDSKIKRRHVVEATPPRSSRVLRTFFTTEERPETLESGVDPDRLTVTDPQSFRTPCGPPPRVSRVT